MYRSVREGYGCYSHQPKSVRGQYGSVRVGYGKYGRLHVEATLGNLSRPTAYVEAACQHNYPVCPLIAHIYQRRHPVNFQPQLKRCSVLINPRPHQRRHPVNFQPQLKTLHINYSSFAPRKLQPQTESCYNPPADNTSHRGISLLCVSINCPE